MDWLFWSLLVILLLYKSVITGSTKDAVTAHTVFRAARYDTGGLVLYDLWNTNDISPAIEHPISWQYFNTSEVHKQVLKSAILECAWDKVQEVEFAFYNAEQRVMFHTFNISGSGADKMDWFSPMYLADSTYYADLAATSSFDYFSISGFYHAQASYRRRFFIERDHGSCTSEQKGCSVVNDVGHVTDSHGTCVCRNSPTGQYPLFAYSPYSTITACSNFVYAETMLVKVTLEDNAFGGSCVSSCVEVADGWYQSCIGCNVYVKCESEVLTHHSCSGEHEFDDLHKACVSPSSTTCVGGHASDTCLPPLGDLPTYGDMPTTQDDTTTGDMTTTQDNTTTGDMTTTQDDTTTGDMTTTQDDTTTGDMTTTQDDTTTGDMTTTQDDTTTGDMTTTQDDTTTADMTTTQDDTTTADMTTTQDDTTTDADADDIRNQCSDSDNFCRFCARRVERDAYNMAARISVFVTRNPIDCTRRCTVISDCVFFNYRNQPNGGSEENCHVHAPTTGQVIPNPPLDPTGWNMYELFKC